MSATEQRKLRVNLTLHPRIVQKGRILASEMDFTSLSQLLEHLLRREWQRRTGESDERSKGVDSV